MPKVHKTIQEAGQHLSDAAATIGPRYLAGTARADWEGPASSREAEENYVAGVNEAIAAGSRIAGIRSAGNIKYQKGTAEKGASVIGARVKAARGLYESTFGPVLQAMTAAADAAAGKTRDFRANITNRLIPVVEAARRAAGKTV